MVGKGSFDVVLDVMLSNKRGLSRDIVVSTTMTEEDFRNMFVTLIGEAFAPVARTPTTSIFTSVSQPLNT